MLIGFGLLLCAAAGLASGENSFVIHEVRVFDGAKMRGPLSVVVSKRRITAVGRRVRVPAGAQVVDGKGKTLLPGLIDAHVHLAAPGDLKQALAFGVATELDMFTLQAMAAALRAEQTAGKGLDRADVFSAGTLATAPGGHGTEYGVQIPTLASPAEARAFVDARIAEGSDYIKAIYDDGSAFGFKRPTLSRETLAAVVEAAHRRRTLAIVHIATVKDARDAIQAGADGLAHVYAGAPDAGIARQAAARSVFWTPTLTAVMAQAGKSSTEAMFESVRLMRAAGVKLLAGTDVPNPGTKQGESLHTELELLVKAGLAPVEALAAATSVPAAAFGLADRGRIAAGLRADLVLVKGDPSQDIRGTRNIAAVWKLGAAAAVER